MKISMFLLMTFVALSTQTFSFNYNQLGSYQSRCIGNGVATFPLCFPRGFPGNDIPPNSCYIEGFPGSISASNGPCLPPYVNNKLLPPCQGPYIGINTFYYGK